MALAQFSLHLTADRPPLIRVNGATLDVGNLVLVNVRHQPPSLPQLVFEVTGEMEIEGEGVVMVDQAHSGEAVAELRDLLTNLDPDKIDNVAANLFGSEGPGGTVVTKPGEAFIAAILSMLPTP